MVSAVVSAVVSGWLLMGAGFGAKLETENAEDRGELVETDRGLAVLEVADETLGRARHFGKIVLVQAKGLAPGLNIGTEISHSPSKSE
jgi:hypothetical protein